MSDHMLKLAAVDETGTTKDPIGAFVYLAWFLGHCDKKRESV